MGYPQNELTQVLIPDQQFLVWGSYEYVGPGWCRPSNCDVQLSHCSVNGFWKPTSNENECRDTCDNSAGCVGYAISTGLNRCYVHGSNSMNTPSGWTDIDRPNYEIGQSSGGGYGYIHCYRTLTTTSKELFIIVLCHFEHNNVVKPRGVIAQEKLARAQRARVRIKRNSCLRNIFS